MTSRYQIMLDNYYYVGQEIVKVTGISQLGTIVYDTMDGQYDSVLPDYLVPIAITPEILCEIGFESVEDEMQILSYADCMVMYDYSDHMLYINRTTGEELDFCEKCDYLHEMQNYINIKMPIKLKFKQRKEKND